MPEKKRWSMDELRELFNRHSAELQPICEKLNTMGLGVGVDKDTNEPFFQIILEEGVEQDTSHVPATVGKPGEEMKVKVEYWPPAELC